MLHSASMKRLGIIGFGIMGEAFASRLKVNMPGLEIRVFDANGERMASAARTSGISPAGSASEVFHVSDLTILCVKPQDLQALAAEVRDASRGKRVVSILAGKRIQTISEGFSTDQVARFMPNLAAVAGNCLVGVSFGPGAAADFKSDCQGVARALGAFMEIPEKLMSAMTGLSGSGLAYVFQFVHAMALGGVACGFDYRTALSIAVAGLDGAASLLRDGSHPLELASRVTSPAGTTIQGIKALERGGLTASVMNAVEAAAQRATELES